MPLVSKTFDQLLDFTRTSSATFVGSNGLVQNTAASRNLLTQTQQFDNAAWTKTAATVTANSTVSPDGTSTADTITEDTTAASTHRVFVTLAATAVSHTASIYFKAGTRSWGYIRLTDSGGGTRHAYFNLSTGALGTVETNLTASITSAGDGWYRCTATVNVANTTNTTAFGIANADGGATYTGNGTGSIFIWGAQLEAAATATTYTRNNGGVYPPRFDYDPVTLAPKGILSEEQRTNLALRSEEFDNATWTKVGATVSANATVSPDGAADADALVETATTGSHYTIQFVAFTSGVSYTASAYVKAGTRSWAALLFPSSAFGVSTGSYFNLSGAGSIGTANGTTTSRTITAVGNGWYRITVTATATATASGNTVFAATNVDNALSYTGTDGATAIFLWGAQLEAGAFATSYIPTVASTVTRARDDVAIVAPNFAPWYNQSEGTLVFEGSSVTPSTLAQTINALTVSDGTNNNTHRVGRFSNFWFGETRDGNVQQAAPSSAAGSYIQNTTAKVAYAYKTNDFAISANGATVVTDTSGTLPTVIDRLSIGSTALQLNGHIRSVRYYPVRLSNAQLQALTA